MTRGGTTKIGQQPKGYPSAAGEMGGALQISSQWRAESGTEAVPGRGAEFQSLGVKVLCKRHSQPCGVRTRPLLAGEEVLPVAMGLTPAQACIATLAVLCTRTHCNIARLLGSKPHRDQGRTSRVGPALACAAPKTGGGARCFCLGALEWVGGRGGGGISRHPHPNLWEVMLDLRNCPVEFRAMSRERGQCPNLQLSSGTALQMTSGHVHPVCSSLLRRLHCWC